jgi:hypothetical protein
LSSLEPPAHARNLREPREQDIEPTTIMPHTTKSMRRPLRASTIKKPRPLRTAIISAATTTIHATPIATRSAVTSCGKIAGSVILNSTSVDDISRSSATR